MKNCDDMLSFLETLGNVMRVRMNLSLFSGDYDCACGKKHFYDPFTKLLCQGKWKVLMQCPDDPNFLTYVKVNMFLMVKFRGFQSLSGYHIKNDEEKELLYNTFDSLK